MTVPELEQFSDTIREPLQRFAARIRELGGGNAIGWTLYGAIVAEVFDKSRHAVQSVLMLRSVDLKLLRALSAEGPGYGGAGLAAPLVMTPKFLEASRSAFPLELIEIQQHHRIVFGDDYFSGLKFDDRDVRLQCERELDVLLMGLRQGVLSATGKTERLALLERDWIHHLLRTMRGLLWLKGQKESLTAHRVLAEVARISELPLEAIHRALSTGEPPAWEGFQHLYADIEALEGVVDGW